MTKNFNDIMAYWDGKDTKKHIPHPRPISRKRPPTNQTQSQQSQPKVEDSHPPVSLNKESDNDHINTTETTTTTTTTTATVVVTPDLHPPVSLEKDSDEKVAVVVDEANNNNNNNNNNGYNDNTNDIVVGDDNNKIDQQQEREIKASRYDNVSHETLCSSSNNNSTSGYSHDAVQGTSSNNYSSYSQHGGSMYSVPSHYSASHYGSSYRGDSYTVYSDEEGDDDGDDNQDDETFGTGVSKGSAKHPYFESDISEADLIRLVDMVDSVGQEIAVDQSNNNNALRGGGIDDDQELNPNGYLDTNSSVAGSTDTKSIDLSSSSGYGYGNAGNGNPYISGGSPQTNHYSHAKFLTEKGLYGGHSGSKKVAKDDPNAKYDDLTSWNTEFQTVIEMEDCLEKFERLSSLEQDFVYAAETYGRIIISEHFLPHDNRTIKPVSVGGIAGGEKYIVQGILFKFAVENETFGLYGNDENAMKTASHEINGCTSFLNCGIKGLHVPLMAYIDYRGFRLMAMSLLPISKKSLIYGSSDAGQTVHTSNTIFNHLFTSAAKIVNLKPHLAQDMNGDLKTIHGPVDIEGHIGTDNRFYLLDFARLAPPEPPTHRGAYLYRLLRLELVRKHSKPLCSDAYSPMINIGIENHNFEVNEAYQNLIDNIIPKFAETIQNVHDSQSAVFTTFKDISKLLHSEGINVRLLGKVRSLITLQNPRLASLMECTVRTLKSLVRELLRREMKRSHLPSDYPYRKTVLNFLNLIFGDYSSPKTNEFWNKILRPKMEKKFKDVFLMNTIHEETKSHPDNPENTYIEKTVTSEIEEDPFNPIISTRSYKYIFFKKFVESIGVVMREEAKEDFKNNEGAFTFVDPDILEMKTLITRLNIIDYADGMKLYYKSMKENVDPKSIKRLLSVSRNRLEKSLHSMSTNYTAYFQLGNVIHFMAKIDNGSESYQAQLYGEAAEKFKLLESYRIDSDLLFLARLHRAKSLIKRLSNTTCEPLYGEIQEIFDSLLPICTGLNRSKALSLYIKFLCTKLRRLRSDNQEEYEAIEKFYFELFEKDPSNGKAKINYAMFLFQTQKSHNLFSMEKFCEYVVQGLSGNMNNIEKIRPFIEKSPWRLFASSRAIPHLQQVVKDSIKMENSKGVLTIPNDVSIEVGDRNYFDSIEFDKLVINNVSIASTALNMISFFADTIKYINFANSKLIEGAEILKSIPLISNLVSMDFSNCEMNDENLMPIVSPLLKKIRLYNVRDITSNSLEKIASVCPDLEVLDLGMCLNMNGAFDQLISQCPKIRKLSCPQDISEVHIKNCIDSLTQLYALDLHKCTNANTSLYEPSFARSTSLKKIRGANGFPYFLIPANSYVSMRNNRTPYQELQLNATLQNDTSQLYYIKISYNHMNHKVFSLYVNNKHKYIKFRNPPNLGIDSFYKAFHVVRMDKPMPQLTIYSNTSSNKWDLSEMLFRLPLSGPAFQASLNYHNVPYNSRITLQPGHGGQTFSNSFYKTDSQEMVIYLTNLRSMKMTIDVEFRKQVTLIPLMLAFTLAYEP